MVQRKDIMKVEHFLLALLVWTGMSFFLARKPSIRIFFLKEKDSGNAKSILFVAMWLILKGLLLISFVFLLANGAIL